MPTYVLLTTFTQQNVENVHRSPERTDHAKEMVESLGGTWKAFFVTMGRYDGSSSSSSRTTRRRPRRRWRSQKAAT